VDFLLEGVSSRPSAEEPAGLHPPLRRRVFLTTRPLWPLCLLALRTVLLVEAHQMARGEGSRHNSQGAARIRTSRGVDSRPASVAGEALTADVVVQDEGSVVADGEGSHLPRRLELVCV
jgi:hypothetical protein